jgi:phosphohistidine phosphatase SixA
VTGETRANRELYLLRHAHAGDPAKWQGDDAARPLSDKGREQAARLGAFLADHGFGTPAIRTSPRLRALQTAQIVGAALGVEPMVDERLGRHLRLPDLSAVLADAGAARVVVVGHDPDFSELAAELIDADELLLRKGAMARFDLVPPLRVGGGTLRWLLPADLLG